MSSAAGSRRASRSRYSPWVHVLALVLGLVALWGIVLGLVLPGVLRGAIVTELEEITKRPVSLERLEIEPYELAVRLLGLKVGAQGEREGPASGAHSARGEQAEGPAQGAPATGPGGPPSRSHLNLARLEVDLSWRSLRHLAPIVDRLRIEQPALFVARNAEGRYDGQDIIDRLQSPDPQEAKPASNAPTRFSLANIELIGGSVRLDDRKLDVRHAATDIALRLPFVSNLPVHQEIVVEPGVELRLDGAPIYLSGRMLPFGDERKGELELSLGAFDLTRSVPHLPETLPVKLVSGAVSAELRVSFVAPRETSPRVLIGGWAALGGVELRQPDDRPLVKLPALEARGLDLEPLASRFVIGELILTRPEVSVVRRADEAGYFEPVMDALDKAQAGEPSQSTALSWSIGSVSVDQGRLVFDDRAFVPRPLAITIDELAMAATGLGSGRSEPSRVQLSGRANGGETISANAELRLEPFAANGEASIRSVPIASWAWLAGPSLQLEVRQGVASASTRFELAASGGQSPMGWKLFDASVQVERVALADSEREVLGLASLDVESIAVDPASRRIAIGLVALEGVKLALARDADGGIDARSWWASSGSPPGGADEASDAREQSAEGKREQASGEKASGGKASGEKASGLGDSGAGGKGRAWQVALARLELANSDLTLEHAPSEGIQPAPLRLSGVQLEASDLATDRVESSPVSLQAEVGGNGELEVRGTLVPTTAEMSVQVIARSLPLEAAQPWIPPRVNARIASGALSADGKFELRLGDAGEAEGGWQGAVTVADFDARLKQLDPSRGSAPESGSARRAGSGLEEEASAPSAPSAPAESTESAPSTTAASDAPSAASASDAPDAAPAASGTQSTEGVRRIRRPGAARQLLRMDSLEFAQLRVRFSPLSVDTGEVVLDGLEARLVILPSGRFNLQDVIEGSSTADDEGTAVAESSAPTEPSRLAIGPVKLANGNIDFSDYYIDPNYSANLTGLAGTIGAMSAGEPGLIELAGRIDNTGALEITGQIDPIGDPLFLDLRARARDIDLPALSPYSAKYVGYGIEKGKLSATVEYHVENGQLTGQNKIVLDQLRFGEKVESPDALQLPVLFAVSLLKDRNGVIDVELPISGSLEDPQFSVAGIVTRLIGNMIAKAVTAPFALIANLVGASEAELSQLPFVPGEARIGVEARERLGSLAEALIERPGLELEIGGRATPADRDALKGLALESRLRRFKGGAGEGKAVDRARVEGEERARLVLVAWLADRKEKPAEGQRPTLAEMEAQLLESTRVREESLLDLASRRARAAKDRLADEHKIEPARLFVTAPKLLDEGSGDRVPGVELSLK